MQANTLTLHTSLTSVVGLKGQILKIVRISISFFFIKLSTKTYLAGFCYDLNDIQGELRV